jgi:YYY domain-containing protein
LLTVKSRLPKCDWIRLTLIALLLIGAVLRLYNLDWDERQHAHPDERHVTWVATSITWPADSSTILDPLMSTINPFRWPPNVRPPDGDERAFTYGHFPLYMLAGVSQTLARISLPAGGVNWADYDHIQLVGRALSGLWDTLTILLIFLLGKELYSRRVGLLAAAFLTFTVLHIQLSHFATFDIIMATFVVMSILMAVRGVRRGKAVDFLLAGVAAGLAIGSLARALPVLLPVGLAPLVRLYGEHGNPLRWGHWNSDQRRRAYTLLGLALAAVLLGVIAFGVTNPFSIIDYQSFLKNVGEQGRMVRGEADWPFTRQYRGTPAYLYQVEQQVRWGMGWPLGVAAFAGLAWTIWRAARRKISAGEVVLLAWVWTYFLINGAFMVKFMRYMVILTPFLCLLAAHAIDSLAVWLRTLRLDRWLKGKWPAVGRTAASALIVIALGWTALYALAFETIYTRPHTWIEASRWIYENIPDGSVIAVEHWDDEMPKPLHGQGLSSSEHGYRHVTLPLYEDDTAGKYENIKMALQQADYVILASNRLYGSIPRLPRRYPMTIAYYDLLFSGQLGFDLEASFTSYPQLGPFVWVDDDADESFTVYDHPKPLVFKKTLQLSDDEIWGLLGGLWNGAIRGWVGDEGAGATSATPETRKSLMLDGPVDRLPVVDDFRWNTLASQHAWLAALVWWLALMIVGLAVAPLAYVVFGRLRDRGWALSRSLGLLLVGYLNWIGASLHLTQNRTWVILAFLLLVASASTWIFMRRRTEMLAFLRQKWRLLLSIEALFALAFGVFVMIRLFNPDLWQPWTGGEKSMEFAFLNAVLKSAYFVPYDPYFAHGTLNYYYYGQYLVSLLIKLTGITPSVAFNLAIPSLFALTVSGVFGVAYTLAGRFHRARQQALDWTTGISEGLMAAAFVAVMGNLAAFSQMARAIGNAGQSEFVSHIPGLQALVRLAPGLIGVFGGNPLPSFDYWSVSRVIPSTINEFPFWSFLFADLHPHMIGIPFTVLVIGMALNMALTPAAAGARDRRYVVAVLASYVPSLERLLPWLIVPLGLGALGAINTWDLPTYLGLMALVFALRVGREGNRSGALIKAGLFTLYAAAGSLLLYWPFYHSYAALSVGVGLVKGKTDGWQWLTMWGLFTFLAVSYYLVALRRPGERVPLLRVMRRAFASWDRLPRFGYLHGRMVGSGQFGHRAGIWAVIAILAFAVLFVLMGYPVVGLTTLPLLGAALLFMRRRASEEEAFVNVLFFTGFLVLCGVEVLFMKDFLQGGDHYRMNTLFKFYIQVWVMLGIAGAVALPAMWQAVSHWRARGWRWMWKTVTIALLFASFLFVPLGVPARVTDRFPTATPPIGTLDGMAYMTVGSYTWPDASYRIDLSHDYEAIQWLLDHVKGTPVLAEAGLAYYREGGLRVSSYTGLPTLVGMHQSEQRYGDLVGRRESKTRELFDTPDLATAWSIIEELDISLIYIGQLERAPGVYSAMGIAKFAAMAEAGMLYEVYRNPEVVIYASPEKQIPGLQDHP